MNSLIHYQQYTFVNTKNTYQYLFFLYNFFILSTKSCSPVCLLYKNTTPSLLPLTISIVKIMKIVKLKICQQIKKYYSSLFSPYVFSLVEVWTDTSSCCGIISLKHARQDIDTVIVAFILCHNDTAKDKKWQGALGALSCAFIT